MYLQKKGIYIIILKAVRIQIAYSVFKGDLLYIPNRSK